MDYSKVRSVTARKLIAALRADGLELLRQKGNHPHFRHQDGRRITVSVHHTSDTFRIGTLKSMIETQARWSEADLQRLGLLPNQPTHP